MDEVLALFPVLFLIYLLQCFVLSPSGTTVFLVDSPYAGRLLRRSWRIGANDSRLFLLNPFLCFRYPMFVIGHPFLFIMDSFGEPVGISPLNLREKSSSESTLGLSESVQFTSHLKQLLANNRPIALLPSSRAANLLSRFLNKLRSTPPNRRARLVSRDIDRMLTVDSIKQRLQLFSDKTAILSSLCFSLFLYVFLLAPTAVYKSGLRITWPILLAILFLLSFAIVWNFRRASRSLYPERIEGGLPHLVAIALSPLAAIRAVDQLAFSLLEEFHPVAVARVVLPQSDFLKFAEFELRRVKFLTRDKVLEKHLVRFLGEQGVNPQSVLAPPIPDSLQSRSFCPACLTQFVIQEGTCLDCGGLPLHPLSQSKRD